MATHPITAVQYQHSFEGCSGYRDELINGRIVMTPDAKPLHQHVQKNIQRLLDAACEGSGYIANGDTNIELSPIDMPSPDVFVVSWPAWRRAMKAGAYVNVKPMLAVEILSPGQDVTDKVQVYLKAGVDSVWVVDPKERVVTFYEAGKPYREIGELYLPPPLKGSISVRDIFAGVPEVMAETVVPPPATREKHIGEAGTHKGHELELLDEGTVYCNHCQKPLADRSADKAWPTENADQQEGQPQ